jgi:hypothetical protein
MMMPPLPQMFLNPSALIKIKTIHNVVRLIRFSQQVTQGFRIVKWPIQLTGESAGYRRATRSRFTADGKDWTSQTPNADVVQSAVAVAGGFADKLTHGDISQFPESQSHHQLVTQPGAN